MIKDLEDFLYEQERDLNERFANCNTAARNSVIYISEFDINEWWNNQIMEIIKKLDVIAKWRVYDYLTRLDKEI